MMKLQPCSHHREGDYGTRCKSGFVQSNACVGIGVASLSDYPCCKEKLCGRIYADHGGKPPEHLIPSNPQ